MPPPSFDPSSTWTPIPMGGKRRKLDTRFCYLLSLTFAELEQLHRQERDALRKIETRIRAKTVQLRQTRDARTRTSIAKELRQLQASVFRPVTSGVYIPRPDATERSWATRIQEVYFSSFLVANTNAKGIESFGVTLRSKSGKVFTGFVPRSSIDALESPDAVSVEYVELERPLLPALDDVMTSTHMGDLHMPPSNIRGNGVIVGVVDKSLDLHHEDFWGKSPPGQPANWSRVLALWDQTKTANENEVGVGVSPPLPAFTLSPGVDPGVEYERRHPADLSQPEDPKRATIQREIQVPPGHGYEIVRHSAAEDSHGTGVTGCAAGNGNAQSGTYTGAAPDAEIIFVAYRPEERTERLADSSSVLDGCRFIFARAKALNRPCVVNISLNDNLGPHDGTSPLEVGLDDQLATDTRRVVTVSAGNANDKMLHASGNVVAGVPTDIVLKYQGLGTVMSYANDQAEIWYRSGDVLKLTVLVGGVAVLGPVAGSATPPHPLPNVLVGGAKLIVRSLLDDPRNHQNVITLMLDTNPTHANPPPDIEIPDITLRLEAETLSAGGGFHAWLGGNNEGNSSLSPVDAVHGTIRPPATAAHVFAVAAHDKDDPPAITGYSGRGFSEPGRRKPDIAATGGTEARPVHVPMSRDWKDTLAMSYTPYHPATGTSFAAPIVAGACALLFECRGGTGGAADLLSDLTGAAGTGVPDTDFGAGYLQMDTVCSPFPAIPVWRGRSYRRIVDEFFDPPPPPDPAWWLSPDIRIAVAENRFADNPLPKAAWSDGYRVQVTVRNSSRKPLDDVTVELFWAKLGTGLVSVDDWSHRGISAPAGKNRLVLESVAAKSETIVEFDWMPPKESRNGGPASYSFLARIDHAARPQRNLSARTVGIGEPIALRSLVRKKLSSRGAASMDFFVSGSGGPASLQFVPEGTRGEMVVRIPIDALPWRDRDYLDRRGTRSSLQGGDVASVTDVVGAQALKLGRSVASIVVPPGERLRIPDLRVGKRAPLAVHLELRGAKLAGPRGFVHVIHVSSARAAGGVSLELR